ncbi:MAG TPA: hypothetical protein VF733_04465 [Candidatus Saccharimonadales bacterium]
MLRVWSAISRGYSNQRGFSPVEVLLAATVFGFVVVALIGAIIYGRESTAGAGDRSRAVFLADEGLQAVRNIRDSGFSTLTDGTYYLSQTGNQWGLASTCDANCNASRQVTIAANGADRKNVTSTASWTIGGNLRQVSVNTMFSNWLASITTTGPIMMAYSKTTTTPYYRIWNGTDWSAEAAAQNVAGNINYVVLKSARTRNEAILGVQTSTGAIYIQIWNGTSWGNLTSIGGGSTSTRSFDIAYEKNSDRAVIAYSPNTVAVDFAYRTWNGSALSAETVVAAPPTTGLLNWIELDPNPLSGSNEVSMIMLDSNADVYGMAWNGSSWGTMGTAAVWDATAATATKKSIDVEYEQTSGKAMFIWGDAVATDQYYRTWNGTTLSAATLLDIAAEGGVAEWVQLASRPNSNEIMFGVQDAGADLNTRKWSGSAWDTATQHAEHSAATENITSRNFDIVWETHASNAGKAWLMWGDSLTVTTKQWSGSAWGTASVLSGSDDTSFVRLRADPASGAIFAGIYQNATSASRDLNERRLTGGSATWSAKNTIWAGPTASDPVYFRVDISTP